MFRDEDIQEYYGQVTKPLFDYGMTLNIPFLGQKPGRPRKYYNNAAKQRAYRRRKSVTKSKE